MSFMNQLNFDASIHDIFDANGNRVDSKIGRGVYRDDTNELLAICGPSTHLVQHHEVVDPILSNLTEAGYKVEEVESWDRMDLRNLVGERKALVKCSLTDNGAVMRTDFVTGDFVDVTSREGSFGLAKGEDTNLFKGTLLNSLNSKYAARANTSYERIVCLNGMTSALFSANFYGKHTANFSINSMQAQLGNAFDMIENDAERFQLWANTKIDVKAAEAMLKLTLAKLANKPNGDAHFSEPLLNNILSRFQKEDATVWGLYNAITAWQTHEGFKSNANPMTATIGREQKVSQMLNSNPWQAFVAEAA